jgi:predicted RNA-binding Zn-ribbon protein involved in translation (DUF1610 family)
MKKGRGRKYPHKVADLPPPKRMPVHRCARCGYVVTDVEWNAMRFYLPCPRCGERSFERVFI